MSVETTALDAIRHLFPLAGEGSIWKKLSEVPMMMARKRTLANNGIVRKMQIPLLGLRVIRSVLGACTPRV